MILGEQYIESANTFKKNPIGGLHYILYSTDSICRLYEIRGHYCLLFSKKRFANSFFWFLLELWMLMIWTSIIDVHTFHWHLVASLASLICMCKHKQSNNSYIFLRISGDRCIVQTCRIVGQLQKRNHVFSSFSNHFHMSDDIQLFSPWYAGKKKAVALNQNASKYVIIASFIPAYILWLCIIMHVFLSCCIFFSWSSSTFMNSRSILMLIGLHV